VTFLHEFIGISLFTIHDIYLYFLILLTFFPLRNGKRASSG